MKVAKRLRRHLAAHRRTRPLQGRKTGRGERAPEDAASVETGSESPAGEGEPDQQPEGGAVIISPTPHEIGLWLQSTLLLPKQLFPLVADGQSDDALAAGGHTPKKKVAKPPAQWIIPYAMGAVRSIRYELIGYELGEIQKIENILRGESRKTINRHLKRAASDSTESRLDDSRKTDDQSLASTDLINQVQKTLSDHVTRTAIDEYQTDYGMPTDQDLKVKGNWWVEEQPAGGFLEDISNFAKDIVDKTVNRISKQVNITRSLSEFEENEITDSSKFENVSGEGNIRGVYQWVNKSYRVCSRNLGNRLILEIMLDDPAAHFLKTLKRIFEIDLEPPASPQSLGLESYSDILAEKPATDTDDKGGTHAAAASLYYLDLFEQFGVSNVVPPPQDKVTIGKYIKSRNPVSETVIEVPA